MEDSLEEKVDFVIRHQRIILEPQLEKGVPLNYIDETGQYGLEYPDGRIVKAELPELKIKQNDGQ